MIILIRRFLLAKVISWQILTQGLFWVDLFFGIDIHDSKWTNYLNIFFIFQSHYCVQKCLVWHGPFKVIKKYLRQFSSWEISVSSNEVTLGGSRLTIRRSWVRILSNTRWKWWQRHARIDFYTHPGSFKNVI